MTTQSLPNGKVLEDIPYGTSKEDIRQMTLDMGMATEEEWKEWAPELTPFTTKAMDWIKENAEVPAGIGGAILGTVAGIPAGPIGMATGAVIGGASGSASGSLLSDHLAGEDLDYGTAVNEAALSVGIDLLTLGAGKFGVKPIMALIKQKRANGLTPQQAADEVIAQSKGGEGLAGSEESLKASQQLLSEGGATLTPYQTGQATGFQIFGEKLANMGILSSKKMSDNAAQVNTVVSDSFNQILTSAGKQEGLDPDAIGGAIHAVIVAGKDSLSKTYGDGLTKISGNMAGRIAPTAPIKNALDLFVKRHSDELMSTLHPDAKKLVDEFLIPLQDINKTNAKSIINFEKTFKVRLRSLSDPNSKEFNDTAARQLGDLSATLKNAVEQSLRTVDIPTADAYKALNKSYAEGLNTLLPLINKNVMVQGNKESFSSLGDVLVGEGSLSATKAMYKSIDEAFKQIGGSTIHFANAQEVKATIRNGYLKKLMTDIGQESFDTKKYKNKAKEYLTPKKKARFALIMGDKYKPVNQLLNTMQEAATSPTSNIGELALRAREFSAAFAIGATTFLSGSGGLGGAAESLATGALIFMVPSFLAKAATDPKHVNKILAFQKMDFKGSTKAMNIAATNLISDVMLSATEEERSGIIDDFNKMTFGTSQ